MLNDCSLLFPNQNVPISLRFCLVSGTTYMQRGILSEPRSYCIAD